MDRLSLSAKSPILYSDEEEHSLSIWSDLLFLLSVCSSSDSSRSSLMRSLRTPPQNSSDTGSDNSSDTGSDVVTPPSLEGSWTSDCKNRSGDNPGSERSEMTFQGEIYSTEWRDFSAPDCPAESVKSIQRTTGTFSIPAASTAVEGSYELNILDLTESYTPMTPEEADTYNSSKLCDFEGWQSGVEHFCEAPPPVYTIYKIDSDQLTLGRCNVGMDTDCSSAEKRSTELDPEALLTRTSTAL